VATELTLRRVLPFPPATVFAAWIDPDRLARWMSPFGEAQADVDARVGGRFWIVMLGPDRTIEHTGEYREVDPPRRLVFTWRSPTPARPAAWSRSSSGRSMAARS
jgi:uncharacterized protein YndB with AHSA1/START domain